jgi:hypothetical protein
VNVQTEGSIQSTRATIAYNHAALTRTPVLQKDTHAEEKANALDANKSWKLIGIVKVFGGAILTSM